MWKLQYTGRKINWVDCVYRKPLPTQELAEAEARRLNSFYKHDGLSDVPLWQYRAVESKQRAEK